MQDLCAYKSVWVSWPCVNIHISGKVCQITFVSLDTYKMGCELHLDVLRKIILAYVEF